QAEDGIRARHVTGVQTCALPILPPLAPVADVVHAAGYHEADPDQVFATIDSLRIPIEYLANLFTAGKVETVRTVLHRLAAIRSKVGRASWRDRGEMPGGRGEVVK